VSARGCPNLVSNVLRLPLAAILFAAVACGSIAGAPGTGVTAQADAHATDADKCDTEGRPVVEGYSNTLTLVAALPTTAGAAAHWEMTKNGPNGPRPVVSRWAALPPDYRVLFCYFDGDFAKVAYSRPYFAPPLIHERALVFVTEGQGPSLSHIGPRATNALTAP
jgi:hypothetical protein